MEHRLGILLRIRRRASKLPMPSILLANVQSLENKIDDLLLKWSYQRVIKNYNSLCFTETWLNEETDNIEQAGFFMHRQIRDATSGKTRGGSVSLFVNNSWCAVSNIKEVSRYCSPEVEYLMISCWPHYLPREFSSVLFVAVYLPVKLALTCWPDPTHRVRERCKINVEIHVIQLLHPYCSCAPRNVCDAKG